MQRLVLPFLDAITGKSREETLVYRKGEIVTNIKLGDAINMKKKTFNSKEKNDSEISELCASPRSSEWNADSEGDEPEKYHLWSDLDVSSDSDESTGLNEIGNFREEAMDVHENIYSVIQTSNERTSMNDNSTDKVLGERNPPHVEMCRKPNGLSSPPPSKKNVVFHSLCFFIHMTFNPLP